MPYCFIPTRRLHLTTQLFGGTSRIWADPMLLDEKALYFSLLAELEDEWEAVIAPPIPVRY
jgi:hypothetical protein